MDSFFTSRELAEKLLKRTSVVGTTRANRREILTLVKLPLHKSLFYRSSSLNLTVYQAKQNKSTLVLSTLHKWAARQGDGKKKPETILYYNRSKCGVDMLDYYVSRNEHQSSLQKMTTGYLVQNSLSNSENAWGICRLLLFELSKQLKESKACRRASAAVDSCSVSGKLKERVTCEVGANCKRNRKTTKCTQCKRPVCKQCFAAFCARCKLAWAWYEIC